MYSPSAFSKYEKGNPSSVSYETWNFTEKEMSFISYICLMVWHFYGKLLIRKLQTKIIIITICNFTLTIDSLNGNCLYRVKGLTNKCDTCFTHYHYDAQNEHTSVDLEIQTYITFSHLSTFKTIEGCFKHKNAWHCHNNESNLSRTVVSFSEGNTFFYFSFFSSKFEFTSFSSWSEDTGNF